MNTQNDLKWRKRAAEPRCGVYMLMLHGNVEYIGKSTDVDARVASHRKEGRIHFDCVSVAEVPQDALDDAERALIKQHRPPKNVVHNEDCVRRGKKGVRLPFKSVEVLLPLDIVRMLEYLADCESRTTRNILWILIEEAYVRRRSKDYRHDFALLNHTSPTPKEGLTQ